MRPPFAVKPVLDDHFALFTFPTAHPHKSRKIRVCEIMMLWQHIAQRRSSFLQWRHGANGVWTGMLCSWTLPPTWHVFLPEHWAHVPQEPRQHRDPLVLLSASSLSNLVHGTDRCSPPALLQKNASSESPEARHNRTRFCHKSCLFELWLWLWMGFFLSKY